MELFIILLVALIKFTDGRPQSCAVPNSFQNVIPQTTSPGQLLPAVSNQPGIQCLPVSFPVPLQQPPYTYHPTGQSNTLPSGYLQYNPKYSVHANPQIESYTPQIQQSNANQFPGKNPFLGQKCGAENPAPWSGYSQPILGQTQVHPQAYLQVVQSLGPVSGPIPINGGIIIPAGLQNPTADVATMPGTLQNPGFFGKPVNNNGIFSSFGSALGQLNSIFGQTGVPALSSLIPANVLQQAQGIPGIFGLPAGIMFPQNTQHGCGSSTANHNDQPVGQNSFVQQNLPNQGPIIRPNLPPTPTPYYGTGTKN